MVGRWLATVCVSTAVFAPALPLGHDGRGLSRLAASAAEAAPTTTSSAPLGRPRGFGSGRARQAFDLSSGGARVSIFDDEDDARDGGDRLATPTGSVESPSAETEFGFGPTARFFPSRTPRELILSFDDGPDLKYTPLVLDELDRWGIKAIFFVTGHRLTGEHPEDLARRELVRKIAARGHLVSNHTFNHRDLCRSPQDIASEIDGNAEVIAEATGVRPLLFRGPYGARCKSLESALLARGLVSVGWNLDPQDWRTDSSADVLSYLVAKLTRLDGRGILLLHDTHASSVFALGPLLEWIARDNRLAVEDGRPPIVVQNYAVLLPVRRIPPTGLEPALAALARHAPSFSALFPSFLAPR